MKCDKIITLIKSVKELAEGTNPHPPLNNKGRKDDIGSHVFSDMQ